MKTIMQFSLYCVLAAALQAQHHGGGGAVHGGGGGAGHGGGTISSHHGGHFQGGIRTFGYNRYRDYGYGGYGAYYWPWLDYAGDYGYYPSTTTAYQPAASGPNLTVVYPPPQPPVVIQTAHPVIHEYNQPEDYGLAREQRPGDSPRLYLIAFQDKSIRAAMTYWVEGGTLHYLDTDHREKEAALASVDPDMSAQLNRERHVPFHLP